MITKETARKLDFIYSRIEEADNIISFIKNDKKINYEEIGNLTFNNFTMKSVKSSLFLEIIEKHKKDLEIQIENLRPTCSVELQK